MRTLPTRSACSMQRGETLWISSIRGNVRNMDDRPPIHNGRTGVLAVTVGEIQKPFGEPSLEIEEAEILQQLVGQPQSLGDHGQQGNTDFGIAPEPLQE